jgi:hypothetical protein
MITITNVSNEAQSYWEVADTTSNQPPVKVEYNKDDPNDRVRVLKQIVKLHKAAGYTDTGWQEGKKGIVYTLDGSIPTAIEEQRLDAIEDWLKS